MTSGLSGWTPPTGILPSDVIRAAINRRGDVPPWVYIAALVTSMLLWPLPVVVFKTLPFLAVLLFISVSLYELNRVFRRGEAPRHKFMIPRRVACVVGFGWVTLAIMIGTGHQFIAAILSLIYVEMILHRPATANDTNLWWAATRLSSVLVSSGVFTGAPPDGASAWTVHPRGRIRKTEYGESITIELPKGYVASDIEKRLERFSSDLGFAPRRVWIDQDPADPARCVTIGVAAQRDSGVIVPSPMGDRDRTDCRKPFRIGTDVRGNEVKLQTYGTNDLFGGIPNSGKTSTGRIEISNFVLDPRATIMGVDGKGSRKDYACLQPVAHKWVWGTATDPVTPTMDLLDYVYRVCQYRNERSDNEPEGGWPGVLVLLEELQEIRSACDPQQLQLLDKRLGQIIRLGRAVFVKILISTQRPTVTDVPSGVRNLVAQQLCLKVRGAEDAKIILGSTPKVPLPTKAGEGIVMNEEGITAVDLDFMDLKTFAEICERGRQLRLKEPTPPLMPAETEEEIEDFEAEVKALDPTSHVNALEIAVLDALSIRSMTATQLHEILPAEFGLKTPQAVGRVCAQLPGVQQTRVNVGGKSNPGWTLAPQYRKGTSDTVITPSVNESPERVS